MSKNDNKICFIYKIILLKTTPLFNQKIIKEFLNSFHINYDLFNFSNF